MLRTIVFVLAIIVAWPACAAARRAARRADDVVRPLVELYTSEGCDSCPPADRWLSAQFPAVDTGSHAIPLAFHVDYWDRLGWKDRFADARYTQRQHVGDARERQDVRLHAAGAGAGPRPRAWQDARRGRGRSRRRRRRAAVTLDADAARLIRSRVVADRRRSTTRPARRRASIGIAYVDSGLVVRRQGRREPRRAASCTTTSCGRSRTGAVREADGHLARERDLRAPARERDATDDRRVRAACDRPARCCRRSRCR